MIKACLYDKNKTIACLHDKNKTGFFWKAGFYPANRSNLKKFSKNPDWLEKSRPSKKATFALIM